MNIALSGLSALFLLLAILIMTSKEKTEKKKRKITYRKLSEIVEEKANTTSKENRDRIYINKITNRKQSIGYRIKQKIFSVVYSEYSTISLTAYLLLSIGSMFVGIYISFIFNTMIITIIFSFMFLLIPYLLISHNNSRRRSEKEKKLQMVMGNLSTAYIRSQTFLQAVESNIDIIPSPLDQDFRYYIRSVKYLQTDKIDSMIELKERINNSYFDKFMNLAINAELGEKNLKYTILGIPRDYKKFIDINDNFERAVTDKNRLFLMVLACFPSCLALIRTMSKYYYEILTNTVPGKVTLTAIILVLLMISALFIKINQPVKLKA